MKKKILWIAMNPPLPNVSHAGGKTFFSYYNAFLESGSFEITLISKLTEREAEAAHNYSDGSRRIYLERKTGIKRFTDLLYSGFPKINPFNKYGNSLLQSSYKDLEGKIKKLSAESWKPDYVILEWGQMGLFIGRVKKYFPKAKYLISEHDVMYLGKERQARAQKNPVRRLYFELIYKNIKKRELKAIDECDIVVTHNDKDRDLLIGDCVAKEKIHVIVPYYSRSDVKRKPNKRDIVFFGAMNRKENYLSAEWFINNVMPLLSKRDIRFVIVGGNPHTSLKKYESDRVVLTGFVDDLNIYFESCCCLAAPLVLGAGIKVKVLEAAASGVPVLTNSIGIEGIPLKNGTEYIHCETAEEYGKAIESILDGKIDAEKIGQNGKNKIIREFNLELSQKKYIERVLNCR